MTDIDNVRFLSADERADDHGAMVIAGLAALVLIAALVVAAFIVGLHLGSQHALFLGRSI